MTQISESFLGRCSCNLTEMMQTENVSSIVGPAGSKGDEGKQGLPGMPVRKYKTRPTMENLSSFNFVVFSPKNRAYRAKKVMLVCPVRKEKEVILVHPVPKVYKAKKVHFYFFVMTNAFSEFCFL